jgi:26S proteasome regulatory subunit N6
MGLAEELAAAQELADKNPQQAVLQLRKIVLQAPGSDAETTKTKEQAIGVLTDAYVKLQDAKALSDLLSQLRPFFALIPKAKTAKIVRNIVDSISKVPGSTQLQVGMAAESITAPGSCEQHC